MYIQHMYICNFYNISHLFNKKSFKITNVMILYAKLSVIFF